ncbi:MAG: DegT/DnrJ/EryC1/StrS family aminotransferase [Spirochaetia bacterium]|nr:DegT/DnrJ/EryC1/StrS family aminotransferase [Spirochaetia bacterium]
MENAISNPEVKLITSKKPLPFARPDITDEEIQAVERVLRSGWLTSGPEVEKFEKEFAKAVSSKHAVAVNSATAALHLGLETFRIGNRDAVIVPAVTFTATAEVAEYNQTLPLIMDINPDDYLMDPDLVLKFLEEECRFSSGRPVHKKSGRTVKAIMPVHLGGKPCNMDRFQKIARKYNLRMIEDAAHAFPSSYKNKNIGSISDITAFSFYATKNLTTGEGGMLTTNNSRVAEHLRRIRLHGIKGQTYGRKRWNYDVVEKGYKYNMTDTAAALGRVQLKRSAEMLARRKEISEIYREALKEIPGLRLPLSSPHEESYHLFMIEIEKTSKMNRDKFVELMFREGIQTSLHFIPLYRHTFYKKKYSLKRKDYPNSENFFKKILSLPLYSSLSRDNVHSVISSIQKIMK